MLHERAPVVPGGVQTSERIHLNKNLTDKNETDSEEDGLIIEGMP